MDEIIAGVVSNPKNQDLIQAYLQSNGLNDFKPRDSKNNPKGSDARFFGEKWFGPLADYVDALMVKDDVWARGGKAIGYQKSRFPRSAILKLVHHVLLVWKFVRSSGKNGSSGSVMPDIFRDMGMIGSHAKDLNEAAELHDQIQNAQVTLKQAKEMVEQSRNKAASQYHSDPQPVTELDDAQEQADRDAVIDLTSDDDVLPPTKKPKGRKSNSKKKQGPTNNLCFDDVDDGSQELREMFQGFMDVQSTQMKLQAEQAAKQLAFQNRQLMMMMQLAMGRQVNVTSSFTPPGGFIPEDDDQEEPMGLQVLAAAASTARRHRRSRQPRHRAVPHLDFAFDDGAQDVVIDEEDNDDDDGLRSIMSRDD
eukprot:TRINITY_DN5023_c0_g1_i1.p1 TRINITY_DN5023_c0_g1~~TRINITY_DN5023_c0_g1_i1.p1  ORF type:complete len:364 (+),score=94.74 TRINITY_DN5023_c0_g1_i1:486-1577(+)